MECYCGQKAIAGEKYCRTHYIEENEKIFLDNSNGNYGIVKWAKTMVSEWMPNESPKFHYEILDEVFKLFDPFYKNRYERQLNLICYRGASKSTLLNGILPLYILAHNGKKMKINGINGEVIEVLIDKRNIVIASETGTSAEEFVVRLRDEFKTNKTLRYYYQFTIQNALDDESGQWTRRAFKVNNCFVIGVGAGMQIRGKIRGSSRPDFMIFDDIYSENNVQTEEGRLKVTKWFSRAAINTVDDLRGMIVVVGTIVHDDTITVQNKKSPNWRTLQFPVMNIDEFNAIVKKHLNVNYNNATCKLPFSEIKDDQIRIMKQREYFDEIEKTEVTSLAWRERINLYFLIIKYQEDLSRGTLSGLYQEYFHQTIDESQKKIKRNYFRYIKNWKVEYKYGYTWLLYTDMEGIEQRTCVNIEFGIDMGSGSIDGDNTCITVVAKDSKEYIYILATIYGKFGMMDTDKIGAVDEVVRLVNIYHPTKIKVGYAGDEKNFIGIFRKYLNDNKIYIVVIGRVQGGNRNKVERIFNTLVYLYESRRIYHVEGLDMLETQLEFLGSTDYDDIADATEVAVQGLQSGSNINVENFTKTVIRLPYARYKGLQNTYGDDDKWFQN